ncbi:MAG: hypothetical protein K2X38_21390 [Gemmataceae bacterium]|nr:hypothetical protein [Gemmataceae bacterium]
MSASGSPPSLADEIAAGFGISTVQVARNLGVSPPTPFRWILKGLPDGKGGRIRLEAIRRGKKWLTTQLAVSRFFASLPASVPVDAAAPAPSPVRTRSESKRRVDDDRAASILRSKGF